VDPCLKDYTIFSVIFDQITVTSSDAISSICMRL